MRELNIQEQELRYTNLKLAIYSLSSCLKLEYLNSASSKQILDMLSVLEDIKGMKIIWYFHEDEEDMEEIGEDFSALVKIPFEFKTY